MIKKDYETAKNFLYTDGTAIEGGDYFIINFKTKLIGHMNSK